MGQKVFLGLVGLSPAVISETLWALANPAPLSKQEPWVPDAIVLLTTKDGNEQLKKQEFLPTDGKLGVLEKLQMEINQSRNLTVDWFKKNAVLDWINTWRPGSKDNIGPVIVIGSGLLFNNDSNTSGGIGDVADDDAIESVGTALARLIHALVVLSGDDGSLRVSVSGGRKSMGALAGVCMSLFGRQDKDFMTHVLVSPPEMTSCPEFYYPDPERGVIYFSHYDANSRTQKILHAKYYGGDENTVEGDVKSISLSITNIPYVSVRRRMVGSIVGNKLPMWRKDAWDDSIPTLDKMVRQLNSSSLNRQVIVSAIHKAGLGGLRIDDICFKDLLIGIDRKGANLEVAAGIICMLGRRCAPGIGKQEGWAQPIPSRINEDSAFFDELKNAMNFLFEENADKNDNNDKKNRKDEKKQEPSVSVSSKAFSSVVNKLNNKISSDRGLEDFYSKRGIGYSFGPAVVYREFDSYAAYQRWYEKNCGDKIKDE